MRIAVIVAINSETGKSKAVASGNPTEMKNLVKEYATGKKSIKGFDKIRFYENGIRDWKIPAKKSKSVEEISED